MKRATHPIADDVDPRRQNTNSLALVDPEWNPDSIMIEL